MNPASVLLIAALFVVGAGAIVALSRGPGPLVGKADKVWLIGDSIGVGLLPKLVELARGHGIELSGAPIGGTTTGSWSGQPDVSLLQPPRQFGATVVLIVLGTNDAAASEQYRDGVPERAKSLVSRFQEAGMRACWVGPGSDFRYAEGGREVQTMVTTTSGASLVLDPTAQGIPKQPDNIHPTVSGYSLMAKWIWNRLVGT